ncbi:MAG: hypothetical protein KGL39_08815 [Patescibacteria group bacterium]|nr:hypothetical protein [Patescibacteria group bacterium]
MARRKGKSKPAPVPVGPPDVPESTPKGNHIVASSGEPITVGFLVKVLQTLDPSLTVSLVFGPDYEDIPMTDAVVWPQYGGIFFVGEPPGPDEDGDETVVGEWVKIPQGEELEEAEEVHSAAEPI